MKLTEKELARLNVLANSHDLEETTHEEASKKVPCALESAHCYKCRTCGTIVIKECICAICIEEEHENETCAEISTKDVIE